MQTKEDVKKRTALLKTLRAEHQETVARTQALLKAQRQIQQQICEAVRREALTPVEVAQATGLPTPQVFWTLNALKKYGLVQEAGMRGDYYLYQEVGAMADSHLPEAVK